MTSSLDCFAVWAPENALWTEWAKPVAFTGVVMATLGASPLDVPKLEIPGLPESWSQTAIVVDLPGEEAVAAGLMLAARGFRPVPLFNGTMGPNAVIDVDQKSIAYVDENAKPFDPKAAAGRANPFALERTRYYDFAADGTLTLVTRHDDGKDAVVSKWRKG